MIFTIKFLIISYILSFVLLLYKLNVFNNINNYNNSKRIYEIVQLDEMNQRVSPVLLNYFSVKDSSLRIDRSKILNFPLLSTQSFLFNKKEIINEENNKINYLNQIIQLKKWSIGIALFVFLIISIEWNNLDIFSSTYQKGFFLTLPISTNSGVILGYDHLSIPFILLLSFIFPLVFISNWTTIKVGEIKYYLTTILASHYFLIIVFLVIDILMFYVSFEIILPFFFILLGMFGGVQKFRAMYYLFLYTLWGSLFMLIEFLTKIGENGSGVIGLLDDIQLSNSWSLLGTIAIIIAFSVKTPIVPFHLWLPLAHGDANVSGSIVLASIVLKMALYGFIRILIFILLLSFATAQINMFFIFIFSIIFASTTTMRQNDLKVLVAYSSVAVRRKIFINYEFLSYSHWEKDKTKILLVSISGTDYQLKLQGKLETEHSMLGKRISEDKADSLIDNSVNFSLIRSVLVKFQYLFASTGGLLLICIKQYIIRKNYLCDIIFKMTVNRSWVTNLIKDMNEQSEENKINKSTPGLPKVCKNHGNRDFLNLKIKSNQTLYSITNYDNFSFPKKYGRKIPISERWNDFKVAKGPRRLNNRRVYSTLGRGSVYIFHLFRQYSSGATSKILNKLVDLKKRSGMFPDKVIDRDLYADFILNKEMFLIAYDKLKSNYGSMTPGLNPETLDGLNMETIEKIIANLKDESFTFSPSRKIYISKGFRKGPSSRSRGTRGINIGNPRDKLVQEVIRMVLEAIYEPIFKEESHGFRANRSCHSALRCIFTKFVGITWCIEGDFTKCFDSINHNKLMDLISVKIRDKRFIRLIWKTIRAGYFDFGVYVNNIVGTSQGSIISPILANIYLNELDNLILKLKSKFDKGNRAKPNPIYKNLTYKINKLEKINEELENKIEDLNRKLKRSRKVERKINIGLEIKEKSALRVEQKKNWRRLIMQRRKVSYAHTNDPDFKKLTYVRYADDWIVGIRGNYRDAEYIKKQIMEYCSDLDLKLNEEKTKITNIRKHKAVFLGTFIKYTKHVTYSDHGKGYKQRNTPRIILLAPIQNIINKLTHSGFIKKRKSYPKYLWLPYSHKQIIYQYNSIFRGILNYYSFAFNRSNLVSILNYYLKGSCAKLLATKYSLRTQAKVYKKFGRDLKPKINNFNNTKHEIGFYKPDYNMDVWDFKINAYPNIITLYAKNLKSMARLDNLWCKSCDSDYNVEMHHVRKLKDLNPKLSSIDKIMTSIKRK